MNAEGNPVMKCTTGIAINANVTAAPTKHAFTIVGTSLVPAHCDLDPWYKPP
jgi:hypothetical protein